MHGYSLFYIMPVPPFGSLWGIRTILDESLIKQADLNSKLRQFPPEHTPGHLIRVYAGIEHGADLQTDLFQMLDALD